MRFLQFGASQRYRGKRRGCFRAAEERARCRLCCSTLPRIARSRGSSFVCLEIQCKRQTRNKRDLDALAALPRPRVGVIFIHPFSREAAARLRQDICQHCWLQVLQASRWSCLETGCSALLQQVETSPALPDIFASWRWMMSFFFLKSLFFLFSSILWCFSYSKTRKPLGGASLLSES